MKMNYECPSDPSATWNIYDALGGDLKIENHYSYYTRLLKSLNANILIQFSKIIVIILIRKHYAQSTEK